MGISDRIPIGKHKSPEPDVEKPSVNSDDEVYCDSDLESDPDSDSDTDESTQKLDLLATAVHVNKLGDAPSDLSLDSVSVESVSDVDSVASGRYKPVQIHHKATNLPTMDTSEGAKVEMDADVDVSDLRRAEKQLAEVTDEDIIRDQEVVLNTYFETFDHYQTSVRRRQCCVKSLKSLKNMKRCAQSDECPIAKAIVGIPGFLKAGFAAGKAPMSKVKAVTSDIASDSPSQTVGKAKRASSGIVKSAASSGKDLLSFTAKAGKSLAHVTKEAGKDITEASIDKIQDAIATVKHSESKGSESSDSQETELVQGDMPPMHRKKGQKKQGKKDKPGEYGADAVLADEAGGDKIVDVDELSNTSSKGSLSDSDSLGEESTESYYPTEYDPELVELLVRYTTSAYCTLHSGSCVVCGCDESLPPDFEATKRFSDDKYDASGFVGVQSDDRNLIICSFRGTRSKTNWANNFKAVYWSARAVGFDEAPRDAFVHLGFWNTFDSIAEEALAEVVRLKEIYPDHLVCVTGHSLGGALATYCALKLTLKGIKVAGYTFGQPRTGNGKWASYFDKLVPHFFRIVNNYDVVPHLPMRATGYTHIGKQLWFSYKIKGQEAKLIKTNKNNVHLTDKINQEELKTKSLNGVPFYKLNIVDHLVYYERVTGHAKVCKPGTEEALPKRKYGPVTLFEKSFCDFISNPQHSTVLLVYSCSTNSPAWKKHPDRKKLRELDKRYRNEKQELLFAEINTAAEKVPPMFRIESADDGSGTGDSDSGTGSQVDVVSIYSRLWLIQTRENKPNEKCAKMVEFEPKKASNFCEKHVKKCHDKSVDYREELVWKEGLSCHKMAGKSRKAKVANGTPDDSSQVIAV